jgi:TRAP-type C4-dicarboxylate transport system permease small subunit
VALQILAVVLTLVLTFAVSWQIISRYLVQASTPWTSELASYSFVWLAMIAIALGVRRGRHMVLDIWEYLPSKRWLVVTVHTVAALVVVIVLALLVWFGIEGLPTAFRRTISSLGIPFGWVTLAVPVGAAFAAIFAIEAWWRAIRAPLGETPSDIPLIFEPADQPEKTREI